MEQGPPRQQDPLALAFFGVALALLAGLLLYVLVFKAPEPATPARAQRAPGLVEELQRFVSGLVEKFGERPAEKPAAKVPAKPAAVAAVPAPTRPPAVA